MLLYQIKVIWEFQMSNINTLKQYSWKQKRIAEINSMPFKSDDTHPHFDEVMAIYISEHETYEKFIKEYKNGN